MTPNGGRKTSPAQSDSTGQGSGDGGGGGGWQHQVPPSRQHHSGQGEVGPRSRFLSPSPGPAPGVFLPRRVGSRRAGSSGPTVPAIGLGPRRALTWHVAS